MNKQISLNSRHSAASTVGTLRQDLATEFGKLRQEQPRLFRLTLNEAEGLAWQTEYPELVLPLLAREKLQKLADWNSRQKQVLYSTHQELSLAA